ncbi:MHYT [Penicillium digitatum]|uniref:MHYT n=1 Tax=Penicillium digitatum TaxID=36651 RepID=A0A7T6XNC6_PENDI|nr:MHYT [Penicillium digitatum]
MGGIGIWCMHFIGNRAIVLAEGQSDVQVLYNVAFTGTSFVLPVVVLLFAFYAVGVEEKAGYIRILVGGLLTGSSVCGMHYVGQLGISNYRCSYHVANVVGSAIIAIFSSTAALGIFFRWRASWTDSWWRRGICACLLAGAVSGMHWTAAVGTVYLDHNRGIIKGTQLSRSQVVIICTVLACVACVVLSMCAIVAGRNRRKSTTRAHQLVLAGAYFDPTGRIMVTTQALLPTKKIVDHYIGRTFKDDDLTRTHPTFLWAFRATRNWPVVKDLVPFMRNRLNSEESAIAKHVLSRGVFMDNDTELKTDFDTLFKQLFCVTAQELSNDLSLPLQELGTLYDDVISTAIPISRISRAMGRSSLRTGKGQIMFTVRQLQKHEAVRLGSLGFRFATIEHVTGMLSRRIHVPEANLAASLRDMRDYASSNRGFDEGVHLVSFMMRPTIHDHFEILTAKGIGWSMDSCIRYLQSAAAAQSFPNLADFRAHLTSSIRSLSNTIPEDLRAAAQLSSRPLIAPCRSRPSNPETTLQNTCTLLAFCVVGTLDTQISNEDYTFTPFRLFRVQQQVNEALTDRDDFARELGQELFCTDVRSGSTAHENDLASTAKMAILRLWPSRKSSPTLNSGSGSRHSQESIVDHTATALRDITVRKEVRVDFTHLLEKSNQNILGVRDAKPVIVGGAETTPTTYVDELYSLCYAPGIRMRPDASLQNVSRGSTAC